MYELVIINRAINKVLENDAITPEIKFALVQLKNQIIEEAENLELEEELQHRKLLNDINPIGQD